jgi:hypothetical protein
MIATDFANNIFDYIFNQYGKNVLNAVKSDKNKSIVTKLLESSNRQNDEIAHAANKIVAMLRVNP